MTGVAFGAWLFFELAENVLQGETARLDRALMLALRQPDDASMPRGPAWLGQVARDITALGGAPVLCLIVAVVTVYLLLASKPHTALYVLLATVTGSLTSLVLKAFVARPRPDLFTHRDRVITMSFPSGHAMLSAVVYLTLGALLTRVVPTRRLKAYVMAVTLLLTGLVGLSRIYLGVHWPTDVLAGWAAGGAWALGCWGLLGVLRPRIERVT